MLKNLGYDGTYHDENISVNVLLENPLDYNLEAAKIVFSVLLRNKKGDALKLEDFTFYVMDEADHLYNVQSIPYKKPINETTLDDDEPVRQPDGLIQTEFKHNFLFQDLRIAFHYRPYTKIHIIRLKH